MLIPVPYVCVLDEIFEGIDVFALTWLSLIFTGNIFPLKALNSFF